MAVKLRDRFRNCFIWKRQRAEGLLSETLRFYIQIKRGASQRALFALRIEFYGYTKKEDMEKPVIVNPVIEPALFVVGWKTRLAKAVPKVQSAAREQKLKVTAQKVAGYLREQTAPVNHSHSI